VWLNVSHGKRFKIGPDPFQSILAEADLRFFLWPAFAGPADFFDAQKAHRDRLSPACHTVWRKVAQIQLWLHGVMFSPVKHLQNNGFGIRGAIRKCKAKVLFFREAPLHGKRMNRGIHSPTSVPGSFQVIKEEGSGLRFPVNGKRSIPVLSSGVTFQVNQLRTVHPLKAGKIPSPPVLGSKLLERNNRK
jgi:hypothetical protein